MYYDSPQISISDSDNDSDLSNGELLSVSDSVSEGSDIVTSTVTPIGKNFDDYFGDDNDEVGDSTILMMDELVSNIGDVVGDGEGDESEDVKTDHGVGDVELKTMMNKDYSYPDPGDDNFQEKIFTKREFYYHRIEGRDNLNTYAEIKNYRDNICSKGPIKLLPQQAFLGNFINDQTPFKSVLVFHGMGLGKCVLGSEMVSVADWGDMIVESVFDLWGEGVEWVSDEEGGQWATPISSLRVMCWDESEGGVVSQEVRQLYREFINMNVREVECDNGSSIRMTMAHKVFNMGEGGWSAHIEVGDVIKTGAGSTHVTAIREFKWTGLVYDFEMNGYNNYLVNNIVTHNTCAAYAIAENFTHLVHKYGTKIYVVVPGPLIKENWKQELLTCTGETYLKKYDINSLINEDEKKKIKAMALNTAFQYYTFPSYKSFYKNVLGEKITEKTITDDDKVKIVFRKNAEGVFERDFTTDRITSLDNTVVIIEEAHNLTKNNYGEALVKIKRNSENCKMVLLTGTPMKNMASDFVELINFARPIDDPMVRDSIFTKTDNHKMEFIEGGIEYLKKMSRGYVSYLRGGDPLTMAKRVDMGEIGVGMKFTKVIKCAMEPFQLSVYNTIVMDVLDRHSSAVANFALPILDDSGALVGCYGIEGINRVKSQLKMNGDALNRKIAEEILHRPDLKNKGDLIYVNDKTNMITGKILSLEFLKNFSTKFYECLKNINNMVSGKGGTQTGFIYSNLVVVGIDLFHEVLLVNGYLEYEENYNNYKIEDDTRCYYCGVGYGIHNVSEDHAYRPATFVKVTGKKNEESENVVPEEKRRILDTVFSNIDNVDGKYIKFIIGSKVMNEGIGLHNASSVTILDVYFNFSRVDQTIARAIRHCRHYDVMSETNVHPEVKVYKYCITMDKVGVLSTEEEMYVKAELKYILVKKTERAVKEVAIDCPLNRNGNIYPEELKEFANCVHPMDYVEGKGDVMCPAACDFTNCDFICDEKGLNEKYFDKEKGEYRKLSKNELDMSTFNDKLALSEIKIAKEKIKEMFKIKYSYILRDIVNYIKNSYPLEKVELFDDFFVFAALNELTPVTENDFNKYSDTIYDKFNRPGYIIYVSKYYIFQPFNQPSNVPMYYRSSIESPAQKSLSLVNYLKNVKGESIHDNLFDTGETKSNLKSNQYEFDTTYYEGRDEYKYVGTVDKEPSKKKTKEFEALLDVFKLRKQRPKILDKKRGIDIYTMYGSVCFNSFKKHELEKICKALHVSAKGAKTRTNICELIRDRLLFMEKYGRAKDGNKFTYVMVPKNHGVYVFPYNLEDRVERVVEKVKGELGKVTGAGVKMKGVKSGDVKNGFQMYSYMIDIVDSSVVKKHSAFLEGEGFVLKNGVWKLKID